MQRPKTIFIVSLGCPKNLVDTEVMCGQLAVDGFIPTGDQDQADILLINTCGFLGSARDEASEEIKAALEWKRLRRGRRVVISGCFAQRMPAEVKAAFPEVDLVLGIDDIPKVAALFREMLAAKKGEQISGEGLEHRKPTYLYDHDVPRLQLTAPHFAYVKIADGCSHGCSYCSIPLIRGAQRSREMASVVAECRGFVENGVKELNLISQDTCRYGDDRHDGSSLPALLRQLDAIPGDYWLRVLYFHPKHVTEELLQTLPTIRHLVPYVDIPLQHISDRMLKAMGRKLGAAETKAVMQRIRAAWPGVTVRSTFIVGFPGETEADYQELREYIQAYRFDRLGVFVYSPEPGTPAAKATEGLVPHEVAQARADALMELQSHIALENNRKLVGQTLQVLVEGPGERKGTYIGRSRMDAPEIDNLVHFAAPGKKPPTGHVQVKITRAEPYDLHGERVD